MSHRTDGETFVFSFVGDAVRFAALETISNQFAHMATYGDGGRPAAAGEGVAKSNWRR